MKQKKLEQEYSRLELAFIKDPDYYDGPLEDLKAECEARILKVPEPLVWLKNFLNGEHPWGVTESNPSSLSAEIAQDLLPILKPADSNGIEDALNRLVAKINEMKLYSRWQVSSAFANRAAITPELEKLYAELGDRVEDFTKAERFGLDSVGPTFKLGDQEFVVHNQFAFDFRGPPTDRLDFYSIIIRTLTDGTFQKLKCCRECPRFFIADRLSDRFCSVDCSKNYFGRDAVERVRRSREAAKSKIKKKRVRK